MEDFVERTRQLLVILSSTSNELGNLIGPIWMERDNLRRENEELKKRLEEYQKNIDTSS
jgi:regulator of replication initiation timing